MQAAAEDDVEEIDRAFPIPTAPFNLHLETDKTSSVASVPTSLSTHSNLSSEYAPSCSHHYDGDEIHLPSVLDCPSSRRCQLPQSPVADQTKEDGRVHHKHSVPRWFPHRIQRIYERDRKGGSFTFKVGKICIYATNPLTAHPGIKSDHDV
jgi:hypothetical protein